MPVEEQFVSPSRLDYFRKHYASNDLHYVVHPGPHYTPVQLPRGDVYKRESCWQSRCPGIVAHDRNFHDTGYGLSQGQRQAAVQQVRRKSLGYCSSSGRSKISPPSRIPGHRSISPAAVSPSRVPILREQCSFERTQILSYASPSSTGTTSRSAATSSSTHTTPSADHADHMFATTSPSPRNPTSSPPSSSSTSRTAMQKKSSSSSNPTKTSWEEDDASPQSSYSMSPATSQNASPGAKPTRWSLTTSPKRQEILQKRREGLVQERQQIANRLKAEQERLQHTMRGVFGDDEDHAAHDYDDDLGVNDWLSDRETSGISISPPKPPQPLSKFQSSRSENPLRSRGASNRASPSSARTLESPPPASFSSSNRSARNDIPQQEKKSWGTFGVSNKGKASAQERRERGVRLQKEAAEKKRQLKRERAASKSLSPPSSSISHHAEAAQRRQALAATKQSAAAKRAQAAALASRPAWADFVDEPAFDAGGGELDDELEVVEGAQHRHNYNHPAEREGGGGDRGSPASSASSPSPPRPSPVAANPDHSHHYQDDDDAPRKYKNSVELPECSYQVSLPKGPLGLELESNSTTGNQRIAKVVRGGAAERSGQFSIGDDIVAVNGMQIQGKSHKAAIDAIKNAVVTSPVIHLTVVPRSPVRAHAVLKEQQRRSSSSSSTPATATLPRVERASTASVKKTVAAATAALRRSNSPPTRKVMPPPQYTAEANAGPTPVPASNASNASKARALPRSPPAVPAPTSAPLPPPPPPAAAAARPGVPKKKAKKAQQERDARAEARRVTMKQRQAKADALRAQKKAEAAAAATAAEAAAEEGGSDDEKMEAAAAGAAAAPAYEAPPFDEHGSFSTSAAPPPRPRSPSPPLATSKPKSKSKTKPKPKPQHDDWDAHDHDAGDSGGDHLSQQEGYGNESVVVGSGGMSASDIPPPKKEKMVQCSLCSRSFAADRITKHKNACAKMAKSAKKRKTFNMKKLRVGGTEAAAFQRGSKKRQQEAEAKIASKKGAWREKSAGLRAAMRAARGLPPE